MTLALFMERISAVISAPFSAFGEHLGQATLLGRSLRVCRKDRNDGGTRVNPTLEVICAFNLSSAASLLWDSGSFAARLSELRPLFPWPSGSPCALLPIRLGNTSTVFYLLQQRFTTLSTVIGSDTPEHPELPKNGEMIMQRRELLIG